MGDGKVAERIVHHHLKPHNLHLYWVWIILSHVPSHLKLLISSSARSFERSFFAAMV